MTGNDTPGQQRKSLPLESPPKDMDVEKERHSDSDSPERPSDTKTPKKYKAWDKEEMMMLRKGVQRHGVGSWETIRQDPDFKLLKLRTGVQIKDKWRNLVKFRHLTEEEKEAVATRTNKLNRRSGRSSSFTFGADETANRIPVSLSSPWAQAAASPQGFTMQNASDSTHMQGLSAYSKAQRERMQAEGNVKQAQAACNQATAQLNEALTVIDPQKDGNNAIEVCLSCETSTIVIKDNVSYNNVYCRATKLLLARQCETLCSANIGSP